MLRRAVPGTARALPVDLPRHGRRRPDRVRRRTPGLENRACAHHRRPARGHLYPRLSARPAYGCGAGDGSERRRRAHGACAGPARGDGERTHAGGGRVVGQGRTGRASGRGGRLMAGAAVPQPEGRCPHAARLRRRRSGGGFVQRAVRGHFLRPGGGDRPLRVRRARPGCRVLRGRNPDLARGIRGVSGFHRTRVQPRLLAGISCLRAARRRDGGDGRHLHPLHSDYGPAGGGLDGAGMVAACPCRPRGGADRGGLPAGAGRRIRRDRQCPESGIRPLAADRADRRQDRGDIAHHRRRVRRRRVQPVAVPRRHAGRRVRLRRGLGCAASFRRCRRLRHGRHGRDGRRGAGRADLHHPDHGGAHRRLPAHHGRHHRHSDGRHADPRLERRVLFPHRPLRRTASTWTRGWKRTPCGRCGCAA